MGPPDPIRIPARQSGTGGVRSGGRMGRDLLMTKIILPFKFKYYSGHIGFISKEFIFQIIKAFYVLALDSDEKTFIPTVDLK